MSALSGHCPSLTELETRAPEVGAVAISRTVEADLDTPVSAYLRIRDATPSFLLESVEGGERIGRYSFLGTSPRRVLRVRDGIQWLDGGPKGSCTDPLLAVRDIVAPYSGDRPATRFQGGALGYASYEAAGYFERLPAASCDPLGLPDAAFLDVDTLLVFDHVAHTIRIVSHAWLDQPLPIAYAEAVNRIDEIAARLDSPLDRAPLGRRQCGSFESNVSQERYERMVRDAKEHIFAGNILQVVLSQRLSIPFEGDPFCLYRRLRTVNPSPYMYYLDFGDHQIVGASPELLVQVEGRAVTSRPIAGTRPRGASELEDDVLAQDLLSDEKERAEHLMLVDLARNDVGHVSEAGSVGVPHFMEVERFSHVMHIVSDVTGHLRPDLSSLDAVRAAFPAGTVSGAPKIRAMEIIAELEQDRRGPYAGALGFVNGRGDVELAITIRTGIVKDGFLHVQAGAGIVADSIPSREFEETLDKARAMILAAGGSA